VTRLLLEWTPALFEALGRGSTLAKAHKLSTMLPRMMSSLARQQCRLVPTATLSTLQPLRSRQQQQQQQQRTRHSAFYTSIAAVAVSVGSVAAFSSSCEGNNDASSDGADIATAEGDAVDMQSNAAVPEASLRKLYPPIEPYNSGHLQVTRLLTNAVLQVEDLGGVEVDHCALRGLKLISLYL
jgi:hypothetical protein